VTGLNLKEIALAGVIGALYAVLGLAFYPISFGVYQIRVAEALTVLPYRTRAAIPGLFIGCILANVFGGLGWQDVIFGSLITLAAAFATRGIYHFSRVKLATALSLIPVVLLWIGSVYLVRHPVGIKPDLLLPVLGVILLVLALKMRASGLISAAVGVILKLISLILVCILAYIAWSDCNITAHVIGIIACILWHVPFSIPPDVTMYVIGAVGLLGAWLITWLWVYIWLAGENPNILLAPLPPVLFNAFGVSLYLAPIMGTSYLFTIQMVGIGQLIACYLLGLPLLRLLEKRKALVFGK